MPSNRQIVEYHAREQFQRKLEQLRFELRVESPRRVLDYLVEHLETLLPLLGENTLRDSFADQLQRARRLVEARHNLRVVHWADKPQAMLRKIRRLPLPPESA